MLKTGSLTETLASRSTSCSSSGGAPSLGLPQSSGFSADARDALLPAGLDGELVGMLCVMASALIFAIVACMIKVTGLPTLVMLEVRGLVETALGAVALSLAGGRKGISTISPWLFVRALVYFVFLVFWWRTLALLPVGDATTLVSTGPIFTAFFGWLILGERVDAAFLPVLALNLTGLVLITRPTFLFGGHAGDQGGSYARGAATALCAAVVGGALPVCTRRARSGWILVNGVASVLTAAVFAPLGLALDPSPEEPRRGLAGGSAMWLVAACSLGYIALALQTYGYQHAQAARASVMTACQIPFSYLLQYVIFKDAVSGLGLFGSALIVMASTGNAWRAKLQAEKSGRPT